MAEKLVNPVVDPKASWSILNNFFGKKAPNIPSLVVNGSLVSDFTTKANLFNNFLVSQCSLVANSNTLASFSHETEKRISSVETKEDNILLIIKNLSSNKGYRWDNVSIRMMPLCGTSTVKPLKYLFESSLTTGIFPETHK